MICSITNAERELFSDTYSGTWTAFVIPLKESKMSSGDVHNVYKGQCMSAENMQKLNKAEK